MKKVNLITIDVWDTLIRRSCHPDSVKLHLCRYLLLSYFKFLKTDFRGEEILLKARREAEGEIGQQTRNKGFDDEYSLLAVYKLWLSKVFVDAVAFECIVDQLRVVELAQELRVTYQDPEILSYLEKYENIEKIFVSDFYMSATDILVILEKNSLNSIVSRGYSSCDVRLNKRSGRLFSHVLSHEKIDAAEILHLGDNPHSDVRMPITHGIKSFHYQPKIEHQLRLQNDNIFGKFNQIIQNALTDLKNKSHKTDNRLAQKMYSAGIEISPLLVGFILYVMEQAIKLGHSKIFFFTREGEFFKKIYDTLANQDPFGIPPPRAELLEVSRIATFSASLQNISIRSLMRLWGLYSTQSMGALFSSLDVKSEEFLSWLLKHGLNINDEIQYPWLDKRVISLFEDNEFIIEISKQIDAKRTRLIGYLSSREFPIAGTAAVVDIGWRGTIQDNLSYLLPDLHIDGFYLGLDKYINEQPVNVKKFAFGPNLNENEVHHADLFAKVSPIEMLCNSPNGSVVGYRKNNKIFSAIRLVEESENSSFHNAVIHFQEGVIRAAENLGDVVRRHVVPIQNFRHLAIKNWTEICLNPSAVIADSYFKLSHNESFGLGKFEDKTIVIPTKVWVKGFISPSGLKHLIRRLERTGWPEGYLAQRRLQWFWSFIKIIRKHKNKLNVIHIRSIKILNDYLISKFLYFKNKIKD